MIVLHVFHILHIWISFARPQIKTDCKVNITVKKNPSSMFFPLINIVSNKDYPIYDDLSCWDHLTTSYITVLLIGVGWKFWVWLYYKNMKDTFNEDPPYITHFVALHPFLQWPQTLLTFIRHLTLTKSNLSRKN